VSLEQDDLIECFVEVTTKTHRPIINEDVRRRFLSRHGRDIGEQPVLLHPLPQSRMMARGDHHNIEARLPHHPDQTTISAGIRAHEI
jgi:hypothetical protein